MQQADGVTSQPTTQGAQPFVAHRAPAVCLAPKPGEGVRRHRRGRRDRRDHWGEEPMSRAGESGASPDPHAHPDSPGSRRPLPPLSEPARGPVPMGLPDTAPGSPGIGDLPLPGGNLGIVPRGPSIPAGYPNVPLPRTPVPIRCPAPGGPIMPSGRGVPYGAPPIRIPLGWPPARPEGWRSPAGDLPVPAGGGGSGGSRGDLWDRK
jgi:hypothetical protein